MLFLECLFPMIPCAGKLSGFEQEVLLDSVDAIKEEIA